ncbi:unnamed protein product, partial [marine sediment metagenome]
DIPQLNEDARLEITKAISEAQNPDKSAEENIKSFMNNILPSIETKDKDNEFEKSKE